MPAVGAFFAGLAGFGASAAVAGSALGGAWLAGTSVASFFTTSIIGRLLTSVAFSALKAYVAKKNRPNPGGIRTTRTQTGGTTPASFILGKGYATEGQLVCPPMSHGPSNRYLTYVVQLADIPGQQFNGLILDGEVAELGVNVHADYGTEIVGRFAGKAWIKTYDGLQTEADPMLIDKYADYPDRPWTEDMIGAGLPYAILTFHYDRNVFSSFPSVRFICGGIPLYDPREDTSVGGAGPQRWNDTGTWTPSANPMVHAYNIKRGIDLGGGHVWGGRAEAGDLPLSNWFAAMNACDLPSPLAEGGTEPKYRAAYEVFVSDEPAEVLEEIKKSCMGEFSEAGGIWKARVGGPGLPVYFFTDADIIIDEQQEYDPFPSASSIYNGIQSTFPDPDSLWKSKDAPPLYNATYEAQDGGQRSVADLAFGAVPFPVQVQRLQRSLVEEQRRFRRHVISLPPDAGAIEPLDAVAYTSSRFGYTTKVFEVTALVSALVMGNPQVSMWERDAADSNWDVAYERPVPNSPDGVVFPDPEVIRDFGATPAPVIGATGLARLPGIEFVWNGDQPDARGFAYEIELPDGTPVRDGSTQNVLAGRLLVSEGILYATTYRVRGRLIKDRETAWSAYVSVTTADLRPNLDDLAADVRAAIDVAQANAAAALETLRFEVPRSLRAEAALDDIEQYLLGVQLQAQELDRRMVDAGVIVDPETGSVRIQGVATLEDRQTVAEIRVDGLEGEIQLRATEFYVQEQIAGAILDPSQIPLLDGITSRLTTVETTLDAQAGSITSLSNSLLVEGETVTMSDVSTSLDSFQNTLLLKLDIATFDALNLDSRLTSAEIEISNIDGPAITQTVQAQRQLFDIQDDLEQQMLADVLDAFRQADVLRQADAVAFEQIGARITDEFAAEATARQALQADLQTTQAAVTGEQKARAEGDTALASDITALTARVTTTEGDISDVEAGLVTEQQARADADGALASDLTALSARVTTTEGDIGDVEADLVTEQQTRANADGALASDITALSARVTTTEGDIGDVEADLVTEQQTRANADGALASDITALSARVTTTEGDIGDVEADLVTEQQTRANADGALASDITALSARTDTAEADITNLASTRVTAAGAVSAVEQEISATYGDLSALATATAFAEAGVGGILAGYRWETVVGGVAGEVQLVNDGTASAFQVRADNFSFIGDLTEFFSDVVITGDLIADGATNRTAALAGTAQELIGPTLLDALAISGSFAPFFAAYRGSGTPENPVRILITGVIKNLVQSRARIFFAVQGRNGTDPWVTVSSGLTAVHYTMADSSGEFENFTVAMVDNADPGGPTSDDLITEYDLLRLVAYVGTNTTYPAIKAELVSALIDLQQVNLTTDDKP